MKNNIYFFARLLVFLLLWICELTATAQTVSTLAGSGYFGSDDGTSTAASFNNPSGIAVDASGNVYVGDQFNHLIRKITPAGMVSTLAGSVGVSGFTNGSSTAASFNNPSGVAVDISGNIYVADMYNHSIRKITPAGVVSTLAGSGIAGFANGTGTAASFNMPYDVAVDASGNVYVADMYNHRIRKITPAGVVSTLAGSGSEGSNNGTGTAASFNYPAGIAVDASGNVYVGDQSNHRIRKITPAGVVSTLAGSSTAGSNNGTGTGASFNYPAGLEVDASGNVYVADMYNNLIRKITPTGVVSTLAGSGSEGSTNGFATAASFNNPTSVALDISGNVYVADLLNALIRKITLPNFTIGIATNPTNCTTPNGSIVFSSGGFASGTQTLSYSKDGTTINTSISIAENGSFTLTGLEAGSYAAFAIGAVSATGTNPTLTPPTLPTISLGTISGISSMATSFNIPYTASTGSPNQYSLVAGSPAMSGFTPVSNITLTSSPINVTIPASAANTYNFNLTVRNSSTGCVSAAVPVALVVTAPVGNPFITRWDLSKTGNATNPLSFDVATSGTVSYSWQQIGGSGLSGSGTFTGTNADIIGVPANAIIDLSIFPTNFQGIKINNNSNAPRLTQIKQWGDVAWTSMQNAFDGCKNMTLTATDVPNLAGVTNMSGMFRGCSSFNQALPAGFNTSAVTNMSSMFASCTIYDKALPSSFSTAAVTDMSNMFNGCKAYNQALPSSFNTAAVTDMRNMFSFCEAYNQDLPSGFNTAAVTDMSGMFSFCKVFNKVLPSTFNTSNVTNMRSMFDGCWVFNQALPSSFNTEKVTNMALMFRECEKYNQTLPNSFNTSAVTNMAYMFWRCYEYNKPLPSTFNTAAVTSMNSMFGECNVYDQPLPTNFNTAAVTNMNSMFVSCWQFNQALPANFTTAAVTDMRYMFYGTSAFDQSLASFQLNASVDLRNFLDYSGMKQPNYDATLTAFNAQSVTGRTMGAEGLKYCIAEADRNNLVNATGSGGKGWTITGDTKQCSANMPTITTTGTLTAFSTCANTASAAQSFTVSGSNLTTNITITAPTGFELSSTSGSGFATTPITLTQSGGIVTSTTIYVRMAATTSSPSNGNVSLTSTGAATKSVAATGTVDTPSITLGYIEAVRTTATSFIIPYTTTTGSPNEYSLVTSTPTAMPNFNAINNVAFSGGTITVTIPPSAANTYNFNLTVRNSTTGCMSNVVPLTLVVMTPLSISPKIAAGDYHSLMLKSDGTIWAWGKNANGQLGIGNTTDKSCAVQVGTGINWVAIEAGTEHSVALKNDGTLWAWGDNMFGQLGIGFTTDQNSPVQIGTETSWKAISSTADHVLALKNDGTLWAWGKNSSGQLGNPMNIANQGSPVQVGTDNTWKEVKAGGGHNLALKNDSTLWAWGQNNYGQLGNGYVYSSGAMPGQVSTGTTWTALYAGSVHSVALKSDGTLWAWGYNAYGQLGIGNSAYESLPTQVGTDNTWTAIDGGTLHSFALKSDGTLWAWGNNGSGGLGIGSEISPNTPQQVGIGTTWATANGGNFHSLALKTDGTLWASGYNNLGQLGINSTTSQSSPVLSTCTPTITTTGTLTSFLACASLNSTQQSFTVSGRNLTNNITITAPAGFEVSTTSGTGFATTPITLTQSGGTVTSKTIYVRMAAATSSPTNGNITCVSSGATTQNIALSGTVVNTLPTITLGTIASVTTTATRFSIPYSATTDNPNQYSLTAGTPAMSGFAAVTDANLPTSPISVTIPTSAAGSYSFNLTVKNSTTGCVSNNVPVALVVTTAPTVSPKIAAGTYLTPSSLMIKSDGTLWGWGDNLGGTLGIGNTNNQKCAVQVGTGGTTWTAIEASYLHSMALKNDGTLWAWGYGYLGMAANNTSSQTSPVQVGTDNTWTAISSTYTHVLGVKSDGTLWAWGSNSLGELGIGNTTYQTSPVQVDNGTTWKAVATGGHHSLALQSDGTLWAWGDNVAGELGIGNTTNQSRPMQVGNETTWKAIEAGFGHSLALKSDGSLWAWGDNRFGQLGIGNTTNQTSPVQVSVGTTWKAVDAGTHNSLAIKSDGTLWGWGYNNYSQLGIGNTTQQNNPVQIGTDTWTAISTGYLHSLALKSDGTLWAWGDNVSGELGIGNTTSQTSPVLSTCAPTITTTGTLTAFAACASVASGQKSFTVSGSNLTNNITITAPAGFEISTTSGTGFATTPITLTQSGGTVTSKTIYVRMAAATSNPSNGNITCVSSGAPTQNIALSGTVLNTLPTITLGTIASVSSTATTFSIPYTATTDDPNQYSLTAGTPAMSGFAAVSNVTLPSSPISVTIPASAIGSYNFNLTVKNSNTGCVSTAVPVALTVANPFITRWNLATAGSGATQLTFGVATSGTVNYTWTSTTTSASGSGTITGSTATITGLPAGETIVLSIEPTNFQRFIMNGGTDNLRLTAIEAWGDVAWTSMADAFKGCDNLTTATGNPILTGVTDMSSMFANCMKFNGNITGWNTSTVKNMSRMFFRAYAFNQAIGSWNTAEVTDMSGMFFDALAFNQAIGSWNTAKVTNMNTMFTGADVFNQNLGKWTLNATVDLTSMLDFNGMDCANYSATLVGWAANANTPSGRTLGADGRQYGTNAAAARTTLTTTKGWTITGHTAGSGTCILAIPIINVQGNTNDIADGSTTPSVTNHTDFGSVNVGSSLVRTYTIQNTGGAALTISNIVSSNAKFVIGTPKPTSVAAGASTTFTVTYTPTATGTDNATITINNNDSDKAVYDFAVTGTAPRPFITRWDLSKTGASSTTLNFGVATDGSVNYTWTTVPAGTTGSGTFAGNTATITGLPAGAIIDLSIFPANFQRININGGTDKARLTQIRQWGDVAWTSMQGAFGGCSNMTLTATDVPNLTGVTSMNGMFLDCSSFNQALPEGFNTENVTDMSAMFRGCTTYNKALPSSFSTAKVIYMHQMFLDCRAYNQALPSSFDTKNVTYMSYMFSGCRVYDQALPSSFNTEKVTTMTAMFLGCYAFNQSVSNFNTAAVTDMSYMFFGCSAYNQALPSSFNTAAVINMSYMFSGCSAYNQALPSSFNTAAVTNMNGMFQGCIKYNQALPSSFSTGAVTDMRSMFASCYAFNQSLASFTLNANVNLANFLDYCGMNKANYDATLTAFNSQAVTGRTMGAAGLKYCASEADRANLVNVKGWTITGDTKDCLPTITNIPASACVGSSITITGTNFTGTTAVSIGGVAVTSFVVTSETKIIATVATGNTGTISVTTPNGVAVSSSSFTALSVPIIPTISGNTEICEGLGTTLTASSLIGASYTSITYHWTGGQTGYSLIASPLTTRTYRVAATANGCTSDSSAVFTLTVNPKPATPSITADNMTICKGGNAILTGSCSTAGASFRWTTPPFNSGNQTSALPSTNQRSITEPGTYKGLCESNKGCLSAEVSITITQKTDCSGLNFITITPERPAICPGQSIIMTATGCTGTLTWSAAGATTLTGASVTLSPAATTTYLVNCSTGGSTTFDLVVASPTLAVPRDVGTDKERFKAVTTLTSDKKVGNENYTPGANVIYEAGNSITLLPGFTAEKWSVFRAEIKGCN